MRYFEQLGSEIERKWRGLNYNEQRFPKLAASALRARPPHKSVSARDVTRWFLLTGQPLPAQEGHDFGEPPLVVYRGPRFYIQVLYWLDGTTAVHQHGFCGAFHVLAGSSIHARYRFERTTRVSSSFLVGDLVRERVEYLEAGSCREILPGDRFIHSLFHLDTPSVTVVVRTNGEAEALPQYTYFGSRIAVASIRPDLVTQHRVRLIEELVKTGDRSWRRLAARCVDTWDLESTYRLLDGIYQASSGTADLTDLCARARETHGRVADAIMPALVDNLRITLINQRREVMVDPDLRFFMALLLNLPDRAQVRAFVRRRYRTDPDETMLGFVRRLVVSGPGRAVSLGDITVEDPDGTAGLPLDELCYQVFVSVYQGRSHKQKALAQKIKASLFFQPLFR